MTNPGQEGELGVEGRRQPNWIDFIVIGVYFTFVLAVGLWVS